MIKLKGCPKCHGDIRLDNDMHGEYLSCLQCGYMRDLTPEAAAEFRSGLTVVRPAAELLAKAA